MDPQQPSTGEAGVVGASQRRRGWRLPSHPKLVGGLRGPTPASGTDPQGGQRGVHPAPTLRGAVFGQVTDVSEGSVQVGQSSEPVVTLRLERYEPHAGRTGVVSVRLKGGDALGFAGTGDWVEAVGRRKPAFVDASKCINHTTGAIYDHGSARRLGRWLVVLAVLAVFVGGFLVFANRSQKEFDKQVRDKQTQFQREVRNQQDQFDQAVRRQHDQAVEACLRNGSPRSFCESIP